MSSNSKRLRDEQPLLSIIHEDVEWQDMTELTFTTNTSDQHEDIKAYHQVILDKLFCVDGFNQLMCGNQIEFADENEQAGIIKFALKISIDAAMDDAAMCIVLEILQNENGVNEINMDAMKSIARRRRQSTHDFDEDMDSSDKHDWQPLMRLILTTNEDENGRRMHEELLRKMMDVPGFENMIFKQKNRKRKLKFVLKQSIHNAMDNLTMRRILELVQTDEQVTKINMDEMESIAVPKTTNHDRDDTLAIAEEVAEFMEDIELELDVEKQIEKKNGCRISEIRMDDVNLALDTISERTQESTTTKTNDKENGHGRKPMMELEIETEGDGMTAYHQELMEKIMHIPGFARLFHADERKLIGDDNNVGRIKLTLKTTTDTAMDNPAMEKLLNLLQNEEKVREFGLNEIKLPKHDKLIGAEHALLELQFKTNGEEIEAYHEELLQRIMAVPGFEDKVLFDQSVESVNDCTGNIKFILRQSPEIVMDDPTITAVLDILQNERRVRRMSLNGCD